MKPPTMRFKLDGHWWRVKIQRPPCKELCEGLCHYEQRTIYLHPEALTGNGIGIIVHGSRMRCYRLSTKTTFASLSAWCLPWRNSPRGTRAGRLASGGTSATLKKNPQRLR
jgi:hypothetical protein